MLRYTCTVSRQNAKQIPKNQGFFGLQQVRCWRWLYLKVITVTYFKTYSYTNCQVPGYVACVSVPISSTAVCSLYKSAQAPVTLQITASLANLLYRRLAGPPLLGVPNPLTPPFLIFTLYRGLFPWR